MGDGPVGMVLELLLTKTFNVKNVFRSRSPNPTVRSRHPRAHVLNYRTMEVLRCMGLSGGERLSEPHMEMEKVQVLYEDDRSNDEYGGSYG